MKKFPRFGSMTRRQFVAGSALLTSQLMIPQTADAQAAKKSPHLSNKLDLDHFVADCIHANSESDPQKAIQEVMKSALSDPKRALAALGGPKKAGIDVLYASKNLTIFNAAWTPQMNLLPHNHLMWALIGIYTGREDNILWKRDGDSIKAYAADALFEGDVAELPSDVIHSVTNPLGRFTGGIHIYGGDFFHTERSQWDPETLEEGPSDGDSIKAMFALENKKFSQG